MTIILQEQYTDGHMDNGGITPHELVLLSMEQALHMLNVLRNTPGHRFPMQKA